MSNQPPKDFLALSHGHEWVNFYESFDKLVQDHLSRSSELLRKAMALPEVADREVAQVRDNLESRLSAERDVHSSTLTALKQDIANTQQQATSVVRLVASLIGDLDRLSSGVDTAINELAASAIVSHAVPEVVMADQETSNATDDATDDDAQVAEQAAEGEIDLNALAAMESEQGAGGGDSEAENPDSTDAELSDGEVRSSAESAAIRPHWLSMARSSSNSEF